MTDAPHTFNLRVHAGRFGVNVAIVEEWHEGKHWDTKRANILWNRYGEFDDLAEMIDSAATQVLMIISTRTDSAP